MLVMGFLLVTLVFTLVVGIVMSVTRIGNATGLDTNQQAWVVFVIGLVLTCGTFILIGKRRHKQPGAYTSRGVADAKLGLHQRAIQDFARPSVSTQI